MELLFIWIKDDARLIKEQTFNFSNHLLFEVVQRPESSFVLKVKQNLKYIPNFFDIHNGEADRGHIMNVSAIIGANGTGKTSLLFYLTEVLAGYTVIGREHIIAFKNERDKQIVIYHTLQESSVVADGYVPDYEIKQPILQIFEHDEREFDFYVEPEKFISDGETIYYQPILDLNEYPPSVDNENKKYIDVSTNGLIYNDTFYSQIFTSSDEDRILNFKRSNILRQFDLSGYSSLSENLKNIIPTELKIHFTRDHLEDKDARWNLATEEYDIYRLLDLEIVEAFQKSSQRLNQIIESFRKRDDSNSELYDNEDFRSAVANHIKIEFIYSYIHNFFRNVNREFHKTLGLEVSELEGKDLFEAADYLFANQKFRAQSGEPTPTYELYRSMIALIDEIPASRYHYSDSDTFVITNVEKARPVSILYFRYLNSFFGSKSSFLSFSWRNVSTGENALLDLYSRLYYAKSYRMNDKAKTGVEIRNVYLLIDEGEAGFHPQWQKDYLFNLIDFVSRLFQGFNVQIFLTSHSPFVVSDLPKTNIVFLDKYEGRTNVIDPGLEETFAGNIHELLSHKFFISDSNIGKLAEFKLNQEINRMVQGEFPNKQEILRFINLIGEPVLKSQLLDFYFNKAVE